VKGDRPKAVRPRCPWLFLWFWAPPKCIFFLSACLSKLVIDCDDNGIFWVPNSIIIPTIYSYVYHFVSFRILVSCMRLHVNMKVEEQFVLIVAKLDITRRAFREESNCWVTEVQDAV